MPTYETDNQGILTNESINGVLALSAEKGTLRYGTGLRIVARAQHEATLEWAIARVGNLIEEEKITFRWRNNQEYRDGVKEGVEACHKAVLEILGVKDV